jgi:hypothetical protein
MMMCIFLEHVLPRLLYYRYTFYVAYIRTRMLRASDEEHVLPHAREKGADFVAIQPMRSSTRRRSCILNWFCRTKSAGFAFHLPSHLHQNNSIIGHFLSRAFFDTQYIQLLLLFRNHDLLQRSGVFDTMLAKLFFLLSGWLSPPISMSATTRFLFLRRRRRRR